ncbi:MAG: sugar phosphate isomerase/epimerase [Candidatus Sumerlaeaceae bacterium]|nr:sugar phosphate isomerase/epimerase [Candidatus Sumerlaeaceae bacterium]
MRLGVFLALFGNQSLQTALDYVVKVGLDTVEVGTGNYPGSPHCDPFDLLRSTAKQKAFLDEFRKRGIQISALSCHGNPLHPDKKFAAQHARVHKATIELAAVLGIGRINTFSGCPGGSPKDSMPNWVTCPWPDDFYKVLAYQWNDVAIPYWKEEAAFAAKHKVVIGLEMHPGFIVYNPETLLKLRKACGKAIGANFDPSHLWWQGMDPLAALRELEGAVFHVHAKDVNINSQNTEKNGVLDTKHYGLIGQRSWVFRTVGYGHDALFWKDFVSTLRTIGYDGTISIEHEDGLMSVNEGLTKAVEFLKGLVLTEPQGAMWWA